MNAQPELQSTTASAEPSRVAMKFEVVVVPVSDVDRATAFYEGLGWTLDVDLLVSADYRVVEFTPTGSPTSIIFGAGVTDAAPGSTRGLQLVVSDIEIARARLVENGVAVTEVFHDSTGVFHHAGEAARETGPSSDRRSYGSFVSLADPDGNEWIVRATCVRHRWRTGVLAPNPGISAAINTRLGSSPLMARSCGALVSHHALPPGSAASSNA